MANKKQTRAARSGPAEPLHSPLFYKLHALLQTVRSIAAYEDELCALLNEAKGSRTLDEAAADELQELLAEMRGATYELDLQGVFEAIPPRSAPARRASPRGTRSTSTRAASVTPRATARKTAAAPARKKSPAKPRRTP